MFLAACCHILGKDGPLALLYIMFYCAFFTFQCGFLGQIWYLNVSNPNLDLLSYFNSINVYI